MQHEALAEAEQKIEQCRKDRGKVLDLGGLGLRELPESVRALRQLERLEIQKNHIATLPPWIAELSHLTDLFWWHNGPVVLPEALAALPRFGVLVLGRAPGITGLELLRELQSLRTLGLPDMALTTVPEVLRAAEKLEVLSLNENRLTQLPEWASDWTALRDLHLDGNPLSTLPGSLSALKQLRFLDLSGCQFATLPAVLHDLPKLETLVLHDNPKLRIPDSILEDDDAKKILAYDRKMRTAEEQRPLNEAKMILVGRGAVGKTTLVHQLVHGKFVQKHKRQKIVDVWWDGRIDQEKPWNSDILAHLRSARIVVLLVTECFLNSWYINEKEVTQAMKQHRKGTTTILPVVVRSCHWERSVFAKFNPFPKKQPYISIHRNKGWTEIAKKLDTLATGRVWK